MKKIFLLLLCFFFCSCVPVKKVAEDFTSTQIVCVWLDATGSFRVCKDRMLQDFSNGVRNLLLKKNPFQKHHLFIGIIGEEPMSLLATELSQNTWQEILQILKFVKDLELPIECATDIYGTYEYTEAYLRRYCRANKISAEKLKCALIYYSDMGHRAKRNQPGLETFSYLPFCRVSIIFAPGELHPDIQARELQEQEEFLSKLGLHFSAVFPPSTLLSQEESLLEKCLKKL
ncbi:MAG TPA: hypothetical protein DHV62_01230 [Elusimicrobia bacterium]|jgi:hypothetical protein|nr:hypothetical protein [Elusimicrobiota bacterium]